jgi:hypothetical protein
MIDSASTDILPPFGIDELNCSLEQFWNVSLTKNIVWQYYQLVRMEAAMFFCTTPKTLRKQFSDWLFCEVDSISDWLI